MTNTELSINKIRGTSKKRSSVSLLEVKESGLGESSRRWIGLAQIDEEEGALGSDKVSYLQ